MEFSRQKIKESLKKYGVRLPDKEFEETMSLIEEAEGLVPLYEQHALILKLITGWEKQKHKKITAEIIDVPVNGKRSARHITVFGVLSVDWPGLFDACTGVIHEVGWNISFVRGMSLTRFGENMGIVLIGISTENKTTRVKLQKQSDLIVSKINQAAVGTQAKTFLLTEEFRKLEIYSQVISHIEQTYKGKDIEKIIGLNGEAVKYFAARSRDYIENRKVEDIARQIIINFKFLSTVVEAANTIQLDIANFDTRTEGTFTGLTVAGPSHMLHLEDCLKTIDFTIPNFLMKHNREFTTSKGISIFRIEFVDSSGNALSELEQQRLRNSFSRLVLNKKRDRAQWIESIGGFEQYARAIIPLLVREAEQSGVTQVYQSVSQATEIYIDFKLIVVIPSVKQLGRKTISETVTKLEEVPGFHIHSVKPPKKFGNTRVFIIDMRVHLTAIENTETIYNTIRNKLQSAIGKFRDFDAGMRTLDFAKLKAVREKMKGVNKSVIRELYYTIEDFYRISAPGDEIVDHIKIILEMFDLINKNSKTIPRILHQTGTISPKGDYVPSASLLCVSYPHRMYLLKTIIDILEPYDVTLSRLEKSGRDILVCRITRHERTLKRREEKEILADIAMMEKKAVKKSK